MGAVCVFTSTNSTFTSSGPSTNAMFVVGLAAAMSSVTFTVAATESFVIILKPLALIFATTGFRSGTEKPMWFTVVPIVPPVGFCIGRKKSRTFGNSMISTMLVPIFLSVPPSVST